MHICIYTITLIIVLLVLLRLLLLGAGAALLPVLAAPRLSLLSSIAWFICCFESIVVMFVVWYLSCLQSLLHYHYYYRY